MTSYLVLLRHAAAVAKEVHPVPLEGRGEGVRFGGSGTRDTPTERCRGAAWQVNSAQPLDVEGLVSASITGVELSAVFAGYNITRASLLHSKAARSKQTADLLAKVRGCR